MHVLVLALLVVSAKTKPAPPKPEVHFRDVHYAIAVDLDAASGAFTSATAITLSPTIPTSEVQLDVQGLEIASVKQGEGEATYKLVPQPDGAQKLAIALPGEAPAGAPLRLTVKAKGQASPSAALGLLRTEDPDHAGRAILYTMFEPDGARRVFPALDNPADKASFELTVTTDASLQVLSGLPQTGDEKLEGEGPARHRVSFKQEKPLATYQVAFAVGAFEGAPVAGAAVPASIQVAPGDAARASLAADITKAALAYQPAFLDTAFPWQKYDQVTIPEFAWHGMENPGATFLRASDALPPSDALASRNGLARLINHELAHQWFGDSVTPRSWNEAWLAEAFATYLGRLGAADFSKNESPFIDGMLEEREQYFPFDDGPRSRPLVSDAATRQDVFDAAAYLKGASVLRMAEKIVGREAFRRGLKSYLADHAYGNATSEDLFTALSASGKPLGDFKKSWLGEPGYPVLKVSKRWLPNEKQLVITVQQSSSRPGKHTLWTVPLPLVAHRTADPAYHLDVPFTVEKATETIAMPLPAEPDWIDWNQGDTVLARIEGVTKVDELAAEATLDPDPMARLWADLELAGSLADADRKGSPGSAELEALAKALRADHSPYVRAGVLRELARGPAKKLPDPLGAAVLEQAVAPSGLTGDPAGLSELRKAGYAALGKVDDPSALGILGKPLKDAKSSLDLVQGGALGLGHRGDPASVAALKAGLETQGARGLPYLLAVLEGLSAVEDGSIAPTLLAQAQAHRGSVEALAVMKRGLEFNHALLKSPAGTKLVGQVAGDASFSTEARARWLNLLDDVKTPGAKAELTALSKNPDARIAALAKQKLKGNFGR
jgi:aminopeptidase N